MERGLLVRPVRPVRMALTASMVLPARRAPLALPGQRGRLARLARLVPLGPELPELTFRCSLRLAMEPGASLPMPRLSLSWLPVLAAAAAVARP